ncbi:SET domain-containing protein [Sporormia fimetaria CBS 119925]|uniref:SET domain-containing protein n=1 Tax=Sporormia fimetaria CBS 119925 TaxID=1340428 RepID=A0A6A6VAH2_9PLEO|nr:SET domain-containing protein [Sporormia fimetaria CBS 119925]
MPEDKRTPAAFSPVTPKNWPKDRLYLRAPYYSKSLSNEASTAIIVKREDVPSKEIVRKPAAPYKQVSITEISSPSHPANGQHALLAAQHIPADSFILPYLGFVHHGLNENSDHEISLDRDVDVAVDASKIGNEARFINDYRGIAERPNAEFRDIFFDLQDGTVGKAIGVFVLSAGKSGKRAKGIGKGQEILVSYGKGFWAARKQSTDAQTGP